MQDECLAANWMHLIAKGKPSCNPDVLELEEEGKSNNSESFCVSSHAGSSQAPSMHSSSLLHPWRSTGEGRNVTLEATLGDRETVVLWRKCSRPTWPVG